jgi:hypothetical protein
MLAAAATDSVCPGQTPGAVQINNAQIQQRVMQASLDELKAANSLTAFNYFFLFNSLHCSYKTQSRWRVCRFGLLEHVPSASLDCIALPLSGLHRIGLPRNGWFVNLFHSARKEPYNSGLALAVSIEPN